MSDFCGEFPRPHRRGRGLLLMTFLLEKGRRRVAAGEARPPLQLRNSCYLAITGTVA